MRELEQFWSKLEGWTRNGDREPHLRSFTTQLNLSQPPTVFATHFLPSFQYNSTPSSPATSLPSVAPPHLCNHCKHHHSRRVSDHSCTTVFPSSLLLHLVYLLYLSFPPITTPFPPTSHLCNHLASIPCCHPIFRRQSHRHHCLQLQSPHLRSSTAHPDSSNTTAIFPFLPPQHHPSHTLFLSPPLTLSTVLTPPTHTTASRHYASALHARHHIQSTTRPLPPFFSFIASSDPDYPFCCRPSLSLFISRRTCNLPSPPACTSHFRRSPPPPPSSHLQSTSIPCDFYSPALLRHLTYLSSPATPLTSQHPNCHHSRVLSFPLAL